jgi:hypothetical protein
MIALRFEAPSMLLGTVRGNLPEWLDDQIVTIEHIAEWKTIDVWTKIYVVFISDEDMSFLILSNPDMEFDYQKMPDFDK